MPARRRPEQEIQRSVADHLRFAVAPASRRLPASRNSFEPDEGAK